MERTLRVAAAQYAVPPFDPEAAIEKVVEVLHEASAKGVDLVAFPESFIGGYPYWRGHVSVREETELSARLWEASVEVDGEGVTLIGETCRRLGVGAVVGVNERGMETGSGTAFNAQLFFNAEGYAGRHRKLIPTHTERAYWGRGSAEDLAVFEHEGALIGGLICYEHHMLASRMALALAGEEIHCAAFPGPSEFRTSIPEF